MRIRAAAMEEADDEAEEEEAGADRCGEEQFPDGVGGSYGGEVVERA